MSRSLTPWICLLALTASGSLALSPEKVDQTVEKIAPTIIKLRKQIHQNPELGNREFKTAALVVEHLRGLGFEDIQTEVAHTGVVAVLKGSKPGPVIAVRADMDALPVTENSGLPFQSTVRTEYLGQEVGVSHACGHDIHTAVQLGANNSAVPMGIRAMVRVISDYLVASSQ